MTEYYHENGGSLGEKKEEIEYMGENRINLQKIDFAKEEEFDNLLLESAAELPPDDVAKKVTPWRRATWRALLGTAMNLCTFAFWNLDYILLGIGLLIALLGFRALRRENRWFKACFALILLRGVSYYFVILLDANIYQEKIHQGNVLQIVYAVNLFLLFILCICLYKAFQTVLKKSGQSEKMGIAAALPLWYCLLFALAMIKYNGNIVVFLMLLAYVCIFISFFRLAGRLATAGYAVCPAPVRVPGTVIVLCAAGLMAGGFLCSWLFLNRYPMKWEKIQTGQVLETEQEKKAKEIRQDLTAKGFPEEVARDLSDEEIMECEGAVRIHSSTAKYTVKGVDEKYQYEGIPGEVVYYDKPVFFITQVAVELSGKQNCWKIIHYFQWSVDPGFYGTEAIRLWPVWHHDENWEEVVAVSGRILYEKESETYSAPYYYLEETVRKELDFTLEEQERENVFAAFSAPKNAHNCRAYLTYTARLLQEEGYISSWVFYTHQNRYFQYPAWSAMGYLIHNGVGSQDAFQTFHTALQLRIKSISK